MSMLLLGVGGAAAAGGGTERTVLGIGGASLSSANTYYCPLGGEILATGTTLANAEMAWPTDGTFRNLYARASGSSWTAGTTFTLYKNGSSTALTCTIAASGTENSDLSNSVSVSAGDTIAIGVTLAAGSGSIFIRQCTVQFERTGQISTMLQASNMGAASATTVRWSRMGGGPVSTTIFGTPETDMQFKAMEACTLSKLQGYAVTATNGAALTSRKNTAAGAATVTFTGDAQRQQDNTNSDSLSVDDLFTIQRAATAISCSNTGVMYTSNTAKVSLICSGGQLSTIAAGSTGYGSLIGGVSVNSNSTTESNAAAKLPFACTISKLRIFVFANASSATVTVTLQKNGADTAITFTVGAGSTGWFQDVTTSPVSFALGDTVSVKYAGVTTGVLTVYHAAALIVDAT